MELQTLRLSDLTPYENNPRVNFRAVDKVQESIEQVGYITPIVVDEDGCILAGHTRYKALREMGVEEAQVIVCEGLNEEQKRKFRILDNKTAEIAEWDFNLLKGELEGLDLGGVDWFGDLLNPAVAEMSSPAAKEKEDGPVCCPRCGTIVTAIEGIYMEE